MSDSEKGRESRNSTLSAPNGNSMRPPAARHSTSVEHSGHLPLHDLDRAAAPATAPAVAAARLALAPAEPHVDLASRCINVAGKVFPLPPAEPRAAQRLRPAGAALRGAAAGATQRVARPRENLRIPRTQGTRKHREGEHQMPPVSTPWLQERAGRRRADKSAWGIRCGFNWRSPADGGRPSRLAKVAHDDGWVLGVRSRQAACQALRRPWQGRSTARSAHQPTR
jgi:hypothetical protein